MLATLSARHPQAKRQPRSAPPPADAPAASADYGRFLLHSA